MNILKIFRRKSQASASTLEQQRAARISAERQQPAVMPSIPVAAAAIVAEPIVNVTVDYAAIAEERQRALDDPIYLANDVLGFELQPEHQVLLETLANHDWADILVLYPRAFAKTTCISVIIILELLRNPNLRIVYATDDIDLGKNRLRLIAKSFEEPTDKFQMLFPDRCGLERCIAEEFFVRGRTARAIIDPSFKVTTLGATNVGSRADLLILDDIVSKQNSASQTERDRVFSGYRDFRATKSGNARFILSGTPHDPDDTYARIKRDIDSDPLTQKGWHLAEQSVWQHRCKNCQHKTVWHDVRLGICYLCQEQGQQPCPIFIAGERCVLLDAHVLKSGEVLGWTPEGLADIQTPSKEGREQFALQMEMNLDPATHADWQRWTPEMIATLTDTSQLRYGKDSLPFIVVDGALKGVTDKTLPEDQQPDFTVAYSCVMRQGICVVRAVGAMREFSPVMIPSLGEWANLIHPNTPLYIEAANFADIRENLKGRYPEMPVYEIPIDQRRNAKLLRQQELQTAVTEGRIRVDFRGLYGDPTCAWEKRILPQLQAFPSQHLGHDDFRDGLSLIMGVLPRVTIIEAPRAEHIPSLTDPHRYRWEAEHPDTSEDYGSMCH